MYNLYGQINVGLLNKKKESDKKSENSLKNDPNVIGRNNIAVYLVLVLRRTVFLIEKLGHN